MANKSIKDAFQRFWEYVTAKIDDQIMVVTITKNGDTYTVDKTFAEIAAKLDAGGKCEAVYVDGKSKWILPSVARFSGVLIFSSTDYTNALSHNAVQMFDDGEIRYFDTEIRTDVAEESRLLVTVTEDSSGKFTADTTYEQIIEAINAGKDCKVHLKEYGDKSNGSFLNLARDLTGQYPYVSFSASLDGYLSADELTISQGGSVDYRRESTFGIAANTYGFRKIKFSDTAETPTKEGDICFKLK